MLFFQFSSNNFFKYIMLEETILTCIESATFINKMSMQEVLDFKSNVSYTADYVSSSHNKNISLYIRLYTKQLNSQQWPHFKYSLYFSFQVICTEQ